jgi:Calcineurin-like phosphoesterase
MPLPARLTELQNTAVGALMRARRPDNGMPAVRWLSVRQLRRTAADVVQASIFARFADKREAMASSPREFYRLSPPGASRRDVWVDYVADTGDGFDATFATACCLAGAPGIVVAAGPDDPAPVDFPDRPAQADLLVMGGDEVYPVASALAYEERLNEVLRTAANLAEVRQNPPVIALPGNHDWYDGLAAFRRNFCESWVIRGHSYEPLPAPQTTAVPPPSKRDDVGGWGAFQSRSYFAVQLSARWWLWGLDSQLDAPIDAEQLAYFHDARRLLGDADIILCTASPSWLEAAGPKVYAAMADTPFYTLLWFIERVLGPERDRIRVVLTGDEHHYARYSPTPPTVPPAPTVAGQDEPVVAAPAAEPAFTPELVTCGGGGAFLTSTHHLPTQLTPAWQPWPTGSGSTAHYELTSCYPTRQQSTALVSTPRFLAAGWRNGWSLPLLLGVVDVLLVLGVLLDREWLFWVTTVVVGLLLGIYAASGAKEHRTGWRKRLIIGSLMLAHTGAHVLTALLVAFLVRLLGPPPLPVALPIAVVLCAIIGMTVFVSYLHVADRFGAHTLEAFSGMGITDYKSHLRLRICDGHVTVYVIGMDTVPATRRAEHLQDRLPAPFLVESFSVCGRPPAPRDRPARTG